MTATTRPAHTVRGTCHHDCPDSCGWEITVDGGKAVKIRGAEAHPYSQGELCPKVNRFLSRVYAEDRILTPLRRTGPKGSGQFEPISWDEAIQTIAAEWRRVIDTYGGEAIATWSSAGTQGLLNCRGLDQVLFALLGASKTVGSNCGNAAKQGHAATYGSGLGAEPTDLVHADLVILWGNNTQLTNRHLWPFVETARERGAHIVVVDPLRTITAESADTHIQPLPGTDTALILGICHVLIRDGLIDRDYIDSYTVGFDELATEAATYTPDHASGLCGVPSADIERLATQIGTTPKTFIRSLIGAEHHAGGAMTYRALGCIPLLTGSWRHAGGGLARSVGAWASRHVDDSIFALDWNTREINMNHLGRTLVDPDGGVHAVVIYNGNPVVSTASANTLRQGLSREDVFCVVSEQFMTDTASYADIVLPATTQIEQVDVVPAWGHLYLGFNEKAIEPLGEAVPNTELWRRLAAAMGVHHELFGLTDEQLIERCLVDRTIDELREHSWIRHDLPSPLLPYAEGGFRTTGGKAYLGSLPEAEAERIGDPAAAGPVRYTAPPAVPEGQFRLQTAKQHQRFLNSSYSSHHGPKEQPPTLRMCAADAERAGLADGQQVRVYNEGGSLTLPLEVSDRVAPGVVSMPWGWWGAERSANALTPDTLTDWGGGVAYLDSIVSVSPTS